MKVYNSDIINIVQSRNKNHTIDPDTFDFIGLTDAQKTWTQVVADGPNADMFEIANWLESVNITEWCWKDRAPDRMVYRNTLYFKNERDATMFGLWWSCKTL